MIKSFIRLARRLRREYLPHLQSGLTSNLKAIRQMPVFLPVSSNHWNWPGLSYQAANNFPGQLLTLLRTLQEISPDNNSSLFPKLARDFQDVSAPIPMRDFAGSINITPEQVRKVFQGTGCSKAPFAEAYSYMLGKFASEGYSPRILEIGIGTKRPG